MRRDDADNRDREHAEEAGLGIGILHHVVRVRLRLPEVIENHGMLKDLPNKPRYGLTLGLGDILRSRRILLVVSGQPKRAVLKRLLQPRVSGRFPASFLWLHSDVTILCDRDAALKSQGSL